MEDRSDCSLLVCRQQAWFAPSVELDRLDVFPKDAVTVLRVPPPGSCSIRLLLGRGPFVHEFAPTLDLYFEHGSEEYPTFGCPSIGPLGAGVKAAKQIRRVQVDESDAVFLIEANACAVVSESPEVWGARYEQEARPRGDSGEPQGGLAFEHATNAMASAREMLDRVVGCYALYQYSLVWKQLARFHVMVCVDRDSGEAVTKSTEQMDNFIPFKLRMGPRLRQNTVTDGVTEQLEAIARLDLGLPLVFLQQSLWERETASRFLMQFWIIEHLAWAHADSLPKGTEVRACANAIEEFLAKEHPEYLEHFSARKGQFVGPTLMEVVYSYAKAMNVPVDQDRLRLAKRVRDSMSHGQGYADSDLRQAEMYVRALVRRILRWELEANGVKLGLPADS